MPGASTEAMVILFLTNCMKLLILINFVAGIMSNDPILLIKFSGFEPAKGKVYMNVYNSKAAFLKPDQAVHKFSFEPKQSDHPLIKVSLPNSPTIAIACFQDINGNQKLDTNTFGIPTEPYAFSNNARGKWKKSTWDDAAIKWKSGVPLELKLHYW